MYDWRRLLSGQQKGAVASSLRFGLFVASRVYAVAPRIRNKLFDRGWKTIKRIDIPVVSIGNLTVGGTGKTPTVAMIARMLRDAGVRVSIVSRGYGASKDGVNDEAKELERQLPDVPHVQNPNRYEAALLVQNELASQVVLMDDGFQHRQLHRDLDIVLIDASEPFGYGHLLPRGLLRERIASLRRADVVIATRCNLVSTQKLADIRSVVQRYSPKAAWVETVHQPVQLISSSGKTDTIESLKEKKVFAFCGLGNPDAFYETLRQCGADVVGVRSFPDHHSYSSDDIAMLGQDVRALTQSDLSTVDCIVCTGKDMTKIEADAIGGKALWMIQIGMSILLGKEALQDHLTPLIEKARANDEMSNQDC